MALLDLQGMESTGGGEGNSNISLLLCGPDNSTNSVIVCA
jgi:hypothetical protein